MTPATQGKAETARGPFDKEGCVPRGPYLSQQSVEGNSKCGESWASGFQQLSRQHPISSLNVRPYTTDDKMGWGVRVVGESEGREGSLGSHGKENFGGNCMFEGCHALIIVGVQSEASSSISSLNSPITSASIMQDLVQGNH